MERLRHRENLLRLQLLSFCLFLAACVPQGTEAFTSPAGIHYLTENPSEFVIEHEQCHNERAQREGLKFWLQYWNDPIFRCEEERRCNAPNHEYCEGIP